MAARKGKKVKASHRGPEGKEGQSGIAQGASGLDASLGSAGHARVLTVLDAFKRGVEQFLGRREAWTP